MKYDTNYAYGWIKLCAFLLFLAVALKFLSVLLPYIHFLH